ncbi:Dirigent protein 3, partial [Mucuna pruriens]
MATKFPIFIFFFFLFISCYALASVTAKEDTGFVGSPNREFLGLKRKERLSHFRFYWHDVVSGSNATAVQIVPSVPKYNTSTSFGLVRIIDNALTLGPELGSKLVGRAQGLYASASQTHLDLLLVMNLALTQGKYNGSTITVLGRNVAHSEVREMPVVGGSGLFRFARGYAEARTHSFDPMSGHATVEYNVYKIQNQGRENLPLKVTSL